MGLELARALGDSRPLLDDIQVVGEVNNPPTPRVLVAREPSEDGAERVPPTSMRCRVSPPGVWNKLSAASTSCLLDVLFIRCSSLRGVSPIDARGPTGGLYPELYSV